DHAYEWRALCLFRPFVLHEGFGLRERFAIAARHSPAHHHPEWAAQVHGRRNALPDAVVSATSICRLWRVAEPYREGTAARRLSQRHPAATCRRNGATVPQHVLARRNPGRPTAAPALLGVRASHGVT